jgi:hypothetical protein
MIWVAAGLLIAGSVAMADTAVSQSVATSKPPILPLRYEEDWRGYQPPAQGVWRWKSIQWNDAHVSFGLNARFRADSLDSVTSPSGATVENAQFARFFAHAAVRGESGWQTFLQLKSSLADGRVGAVTGLDEDRFDIHQALVDIPLLQSEDMRTFLRVGRQELSYGSARLVTARDGSNTRRSFDAVRAIYIDDLWRWEALVARPVDTRIRSFDNRPDDSRLLWGAYGARTQKRGVLDLYYLGLQRDSFITNEGITDEVRHSLGARWQWREAANDLAGEAVLQMGRTDSRDIQAYGVVAEAGRRWSLGPIALRSALRVSLASGDRDPSDGRYETVYLLFPPPLFFDQEGAQLAAANQYSLRPILQSFLSRNATLTFELQSIHRTSTGDGLYSTSGNLLVPPDASRAKHIANQYNMQLDWQVTRSWSLTTAISYVDAKEFLLSALAARNLRFATIYTSFAF